MLGYTTNINNIVMNYTTSLQYKLPRITRNAMLSTFKIQKDIPT